MLTQFLADGIDDRQRQRDLDDAVLQYDRCRLALEEIEGELRKFAEDPASELSRAEDELTKLDRRLQEAQGKRIEAETKLSSLADRHPYGQLAEISEQLAMVEAKLKREEGHTDALALLRNTFSEVKAELMNTISSPVEKAATKYLEQICAKPIAEIRLTQSFAAETVAPSQLVGCSDELVALDRLSGGEQEQVFLCTRLALAMELARKER
ncbi:MAG: hypothetical protein ACRD4O_18360, partial [Bryobacteraceae bacterium]